MARIAGVDLPREKRVEVALTYIYGVGDSTAHRILDETAVNPDTRLSDVFVTLPPGSHPSLGRYVKGLLTSASAKGLVVPYAAVLPGERESVLASMQPRV